MSIKLCPFLIPYLMAFHLPKVTTQGPVWIKSRRRSGLQESPWDLTSRSPPLDTPPSFCPSSSPLPSLKLLHKRELLNEVFLDYLILNCTSTQNQPQLPPLESIQPSVRPFP